MIDVSARCIAIALAIASSSIVRIASKARHLRAYHSSLDGAPLNSQILRV